IRRSTNVSAANNTVGANAASDAVSRMEHDRLVHALQSKIDWYIDNQTLISQLEEKSKAKDKTIAQLQLQLDNKQRFTPIPLGPTTATTAAAGKKSAGAAP